MGFDWKHHGLVWVVGVGGAMALPQVTGIPRFLQWLVALYLVTYALTRVYAGDVPFRGSA
jgi:hypothetical protein